MTSTGPKRQPPRPVAYDDVGDIIQIASEMQAIDAENLSVEDLRSVASDLDVPEQFVEPAIAELRRRREALLAAEAHKRQVRKTALIVAGGVVAVLLIWGLAVKSSLADAHASVEAARSQVETVLRRRHETQAKWQPRPDSPERNAELDGADNRVAVERRNYDLAVAEYNAAVGGFPASWIVKLTSLPQRASTAAEVSTW